MEAVTVAAHPQLHHFPPKPQCLILMSSPIAFKSTPPLLRRLTPAALRLFSAAAAPITEVVTVPEPEPPIRPNRSRRSSAGDKKKVNLDVNQLKLNWLDSLSCPSPAGDKHRASIDSDCCNTTSGCVVGVDPDLSGALAVLKSDNSPQVYDSPHLKVLVGKRVRKRLDVKSMIQLLQSIDAPIGTTAYIEQSIPYPQDGKQGWWTGGFGYGLWIGVLVASGYSVVPVPSALWKNEFKLSGSRSGKDESRELASNLFPSISPLLKRKKDHGRAEALLIAAYGKGMKVNLDSISTCILEDSMPQKQDDLLVVTL